MRYLLAAVLCALQSVVWASSPIGDALLLITTPAVTNIRAEPALGSPIVDRVKRGQVLYRRESAAQGAFIRVRFGDNDHNGWVHESVVAPFWSGKNE